MLILTLCIVADDAQADWLDWWRTPSQQAQDAMEQGDVEQLLRVAPDESWQAVGQFKAGDYETATGLFNEAAERYQRENKAQSQARALYNRGVSQVKASQYRQAIDSFSQSLAIDPGLTDAEHNRQLAEQLLALQQQQQNSGNDNEQNDNGDSGNQSQQQDGENGQAEGSPSGSSDQDQSADSGSAAEQEQSGEQDNASVPAGDPSGDGSAQQSDSQSADAPSESDAQAAREALAAEAAREAEQRARSEEGGTQEQTGPEPFSDGMQPLSEADQAAEQLLRRIPDDPAGLLRRKLIQSHRLQYPEVNDAQTPW